MLNHTLAKDNFYLFTDIESGEVYEYREGEHIFDIYVQNIQMRTGWVSLRLQDLHRGHVFTVGYNPLVKHSAQWRILAKTS